MTKGRALAWICIAYIIALFAGGVSLNFLNTNPLLDVLVADIIATSVIFAFSLAFKNSSFYDPYWSLIPPLIALYWMAVSDIDVPVLRSFLVIALLLYWSTRLTLNWASHWQGIDHQDWRYVMLKQDHPKTGILIDYFGIHMFPTLQVFAGMLPVYALYCIGSAPFGYLDLVAALVTFSAITLQMLADFQLHNFIEDKKQKQESGSTIDTGLWAWSRHPNYFGEIGLWLGLFIFGLAAYPSGWLWEGIGVVMMTAMFVFVSIPMMEKRSLERRPSYQDTINRVSMLLPMPPKSS